MTTACAALQMISTADVSTNLAAAENLIAQAAQAGAKLLVLPENFALMGTHETDKLRCKENDGAGVIQDFLARAAKEYGVWLIGGTMPIAGDADNKVRAACLIYNDQGERVARYDKIHLFDVAVPDTNEVYRESDGIEAGTQPQVIDTPFGKIGVAVCYDLRFPEFFRKMSEQGAEIFVVPSAFTYETGSAHWQVLLRARAIENQCYVIAPNQGGTHENKRRTYGHSLIIDPWGVVLACCETGEGVAQANINLERLHKLRTTFPVLSHRCFGVQK